MEAENNIVTPKKGKSLVDAIHEKYSSEPTDSFIEIFVPKKSSSGACGPQGNIPVPKELSLEGYDITCAGVCDEVSSLCKHVTFLDLTANGISDWNQVYQLLDAMPLCKFLALRRNPLDHCVLEPPQGKIYPVMSELVLNHTMLPWEAIVRILGIFQELKVLHLCLNDYDSVNLPSDFSYPSLTSLRFNGNKITDWNNCIKLSQAFPNLENLVLMENPVTSLTSAASGSQGGLFENLKSLNISQTLLSQWSDVQKLREFPNLSELRMLSIPLLQNYDPDLARKLILAYLPNICRLNGGIVQEAERDEAERAFLRYEPDDLESHKQSKRYQELRAKHGELEPLPLVDLRLKDKVRVTFICGQQVFEMEVETRWTVSELKLHLQPHVRVPWQRIRLWHEETDGPTTSLEELGSVALPVSRYGIDDGHEIMIDFRD